MKFTKMHGAGNDYIYVDCFAQAAPDAPLFAAVVAQMAAQGFVLYDLCSTRRRAADGALFQSDVLFVREDSPLRSPKPFFR